MGDVPLPGTVTCPSDSINWMLYMQTKTSKISKPTQHRQKLAPWWGQTTAPHAEHSGAYGVRLQLRLPRDNDLVFGLENG